MKIREASKLISTQLVKILFICSGQFNIDKSPTDRVVDTLHKIPGLDIRLTHLKCTDALA